MATGAYDANGIWNYGEDDNIALFSDTLNLLADSTSDAFTSDRSRIGTLEAGSLSGLIPQVPSSIVISTGSGAVSTNGKVTFNGATGIKLNGVFSSLYETYKIVINLTSAAAAAGAIIARLGTTNTGYQYQIFRGYTNTAAASSSASATEWWISQQGSGAQSLTEVTVANPFTASVSKIISQSGAYNGADFTVINSFGQLVNNNSYTDFYFAPSSSNITGSIQIFGYND